jgi:hypothetical protein
VTSLFDTVAVAVDRDCVDKKPSSHKHASNHNEDEKEAPNTSGPDRNADNSSNTSNTDGDMSSEPSRENEAAPPGATTSETVTSNPPSGGISAGAAVGIAVGGIVAAAGAFLVGRRTRTSSSSSSDVPVTVHKPDSASTAHVQSTTDLDVPSTSNDAADSPSKRDDV